jgi:hypothetical protein
MSGPAGQLVLFVSPCVCVPRDPLPPSRGLLVVPTPRPGSVPRGPLSLPRGPASQRSWSCCPFSRLRRDNNSMIVCLGTPAAP